MQMMFRPFAHYVDFTGRSTRTEFWLFTLLNFIGWIVGFALMFGGLMALDVSGRGGGSTVPGAGLWLGLLFLFLWWLGNLLPYAAVSVRRLHDQDLPGAWYIGFVISWFIPIVSFLAMVAFIIIMALPPTPGPNKYGPNPRHPADLDVFR